MLKFEVKDGDAVITAGGDLREVIADFAIAIHHVFNILQQANTGAAAAFKFALQRAMLDPEIDVFSVDEVHGTGMSVIIPTKNAD